MALTKLDFRFRDQHISCGERTLIMGILNVTPDSFSDGGDFARVSDLMISDASIPSISGSL